MLTKQLETTVTILKTVTDMSALDAAYVSLRATDGFASDEEHQRLCTKWETTVVLCDDILSKTLAEINAFIAENK